MKSEFSAHSEMSARAQALAAERAKWAAVLARPAKPRPVRKSQARTDIPAMWAALFVSGVVPMALFAAVSLGFISR